MFLALVLSALLAFQPAAPLAANRQHLHHFSLPLHGEFANPQAIAAAGGVVYILNGNGLVWRWENNSITVTQLNVGQAGHIAVVGQELLVLSNMRPLDEPRTLYRFTTGGRLTETVELPLNYYSKVEFSTPDGQKLAIFPQTLWAEDLGDARYLLHTTNGQRWLYLAEEGRYSPFPAYAYTAQPGQLAFYTQSGKVVVPTTGTAAAFRLLGRDEAGNEYYTFIDYYDNDNQRHIVIRVADRDITFADATPLLSPQLNTGLTLDRETGAVYAARLSSNQIHISRLLPQHFHSKYRGFTPVKPNWYNHGTGPEWDEEEAARKVWEQEQHWFGGRSSEYVVVPRQQVWETALEYVNHLWVVNEDNLTDPTGQLSGMLPRWLEHTEPGTIIRGLPYCWGGCVTLETFDARLEQGWQAGNIWPEGPARWGTTGVDCSGLIWNCYGYPSRPDRGWTPISSPRYWTRIPNSQAVWMDRLGKPGHTVLYITRDKYNPDIFYTIEATAAQGNDRVMMWYRRFSSGYYTWRYNGYYRQLSTEMAIPCHHVPLHSVHRNTELVVAGTDEAGNPIWQQRTVETLECPARRRHWLVQRRTMRRGDGSKSAETNNNRE